MVKDFVNDTGDRIADATTPPALAPVLRDELPKVECVTDFFPNWGGRNLFEYGDKGVHSILLTETTARKYFGNRSLGF